MAYRPNALTAKYEAPPGIAPWRDLSATEYEALEKVHGPGIARFYDRVDEHGMKTGGATAPPKAKKKEAATSAGGDA